VRDRRRKEDRITMTGVKKDIQERRKRDWFMFWRDVHGNEDYWGE